MGVGQGRIGRNGVDQGRVGQDGGGGESGFGWAESGKFFMNKDIRSSVFGNFSLAKIFGLRYSEFF